MEKIDIGVMSRVKNTSKFHTNLYKTPIKFFLMAKKTKKTAKKAAGAETLLAKSNDIKEPVKEKTKTKT